VFGRDGHPVVMVNWTDAVTYARWAGGRLPTELEWEVAARSGKAGNLYPWGGEAPRTIEANIDNLCDATTPVGSYRAGLNEWGLADCCGNVWEWCADSWNEDLLKLIPADGSDPTHQIPGAFKSLRGGSFDSPALCGRTSFRHRLDGDSRRSDVGFRIVFGDA
jgi:formylglycine-generating enzyme required for sulfatase activity